MCSRPTLSAALALSVLLGACASRSVDIRPEPADPAVFAQWRCEALHDEMDRVQQRAAEVAYAVDARFGNNVIALGLGLLSPGAVIFWPALLATRADGPDAAELARLRGRFDALETAARQRACPPPADVLAPARAAQLPLAVGERLVYEERPGAGGPAREFGLRLSALRRGQLEFVPDFAGRPLASRWRQDLAGNPLPQQAGVGVLQWSRLLRDEMALGDALSGEIHAGDGASSGRLRGQVIALGAQTSHGRPFEAAVIELFGEVPHGTGSTRIDGVMAVDRKSGVLLRLELRSANPDFALRRTLLRIEPAG